MNLSRLCAMLIAIALLFGPLAMNRAMAAAPPAMGATASADSHCQPADDGVDQTPSKPCCAAMCAAPAPVPAASAAEPTFAALRACLPPADFPREVVSELDTPPPRVG